MITPMRRVTLPTTNIEESIRFYGDVLGMKIFYDQCAVIKPGGQTLLGPDISGPFRLVSLQQGDSTLGMLGLIEYQNPDIKVRPLGKKPGMPYPLFLVISVDDIEPVAARVRNSGCHIIRGPVHRDRSEQGHTAVMTFVEPNGVAVELYQPPSHDPASAGPVSPIKRATIVVANDKMEPSIWFYQQVFGMSVETDREIVFAPGTSSLDVPDEIRLRLVILQQGDSQIGNVGLMTYLQPEVEVRTWAKLPGSPYPVFLVFIIDDMEVVLAWATSVGSPILGRIQYEIPQRGKAEGAVIADPNGVAIDLTQWQ